MLSDLIMIGENLLFAKNILNISSTQKMQHSGLFNILTSIGLEAQDCSPNVQYVFDRSLSTTSFIVLFDCKTESKKSPESWKYYLESYLGNGFAGGFLRILLLLKFIGQIFIDFRDGASVDVVIHKFSTMPIAFHLGLEWVGYNMF